MTIFCFVYFLRVPSPCMLVDLIMTEVSSEETHETCATKNQHIHSIPLNTAVFKKIVWKQIEILSYTILKCFYKFIIYLSILALELSHLTKDKELSLSHRF